jgi:Mce-associated membrane protein
MAADADTPNGQLSNTAPAATSPAAPDDTDDGTQPSPEESQPTTPAEPEPADGTADEAEAPQAAADDEAEDHQAADDDEAEDYQAAADDEAEDHQAADDDEAEDYQAAADDELDQGSEDAAPVKRSMSHVRLATMVGVVMAVALAATGGWLGFRAHQSHQAQAQRQLFLQVGRQAALNLTTIDWQHADADVQRLLDSATGQFYDQFSRRKQPFIEVLKKAQSKSVGTITDAGLESDSGDKAQVLVAVSIKTTNLGVADQPPREWRMRISVEKSGGEVKVSNVAFVQ